MESYGITQFSLDRPDAVAIAAYRALPAGEIKGVVQIAHGMSEHFGRYRRLAERLNDAGYAAFGSDHRGHGGSADAHGLGDFGPGGFGAVVDDMAALTAVAKSAAPGRPLALLAHSMGSFAAQLYLLDHHRELDALALSGTAALDKLLESLLAGGGPVTLELLDASFEPARTAFDWLSRDEAEVDAYMADPLCGFHLSDAAMGSLFALGSSARHDPRLTQVRSNLPIYVISGESDPVVGPHQGFARALIESYEAAGLLNIEHRIYAGGRHEMFNEICRDQVEVELIAWLDRALFAA
ncbi:MAG TPA: alpha/beta fold hydrolase [Caulobacteraceae bacterium]|jgi:alpha-beta hydrolase superfamily lysophospholipase